MLKQEMFFCLFVLFSGTFLFSGSEGKSVASRLLSLLLSSLSTPALRSYCDLGLETSWASVP